MLFEAAVYLLAVTNVLSFLLSAWGALFILWGAAKAARRMFWAEAEPWKGPQIPRLEEVRTAFGHRILLGLEFFVAGDIVRLLIDPSLNDLIRIGIIVAIRITLGLAITREIRLPALAPRAQKARVGG
ncbi:MAG: hypothetical protein G01um101438_114 [Parcubacteria group bacterium Gr01-1014_38]|nr:MAG: hypothetical protein G01um101438_114 [Parcubacteria group bacterium Gr01-1014_38]